MQILFLLGAIALIAGVGLIITRGNSEDNADVISLIDKLKKFATGMGQGIGETANPNASAERYEKSEDGKVVYAFKPKGGESSEDKPDDGAETAEKAEDDEPDDGA
jgi:hypothetical protein